ncbi:MAG: PUR family DNA/RNA-binding protein [Flavobacteriales bacterium]|nr:PUR family DNA/RNA-binding protein [Flavobacteriales bacterium]
MGEKREIEEIFSKAVRAGRRTYFFDVRSTRAGDYYLTITESKRDFNEDGTPFYRKHKLYLYKEDFVNFKDALAELTDYVIKEKGEEIISLNKSQNKEEEKAVEEKKEEKEQTTDFTEVSFDDLGNEETEKDEDDKKENKD